MKRGCIERNELRIVLNNAYNHITYMYEKVLDSYSYCKATSCIQDMYVHLVD